jgi:Phytanoyl-CoA dioxygenase (PhyH)
VQAFGAMGIRDELDATGYAVVPELIPREMCARVVTAMEARTGLDVDDPSTWDKVPSAVPLWGHQSQWDVRQLPALHDAWTQAWGTHELWVSYDSCGFTPPWRPGGSDGLPIHWDADPRDQSTKFLQGTVALSDTPAQGGGFRCAPSWRHAADRWPSTWPQQSWGDVWEVDPPTADIVEVGVQVGDVTIWESSLPHGTSRNLTTFPRLVFFVSFRLTGSTDEATRRVQDFESRMTHDHQQWKPEHDQPEPWPPAALSAHGERILGRHAWDRA